MPTERTAVRDLCRARHCGLETARIESHLGPGRARLRTAVHVLLKSVLLLLQLVAKPLGSRRSFEVARRSNGGFTTVTHILPDSSSHAGTTSAETAKRMFVHRLHS